MYLLTVLLGSLLTLQSATTEKHGAQCSIRCITSKLPHGDIYAKCKLSYPLQLNCSSGLLHQLENVSFLDLSYNNLTRVPTGMFSSCKDLKILNLAANNITEIEPGVFNDLKKLQYLNLSFNNLRKWTVNYSNEALLLNDLDVTGNKEWLPNEGLLHLKNLKTVRGVTWTKYCKQCWLVKSELYKVFINSSSNSSCPSYDLYSLPDGWPWHKQIQYGQAFDFVKAGFWPTCLCSRDCFIHQSHLPLIRAQSDVTLEAMYCLYATGSVAVLLNIAVIAIIAFHRNLRSHLSAVLICNLAVCDVLIGLFSVLYARCNSPRIFVDALNDMMEGNYQVSDRQKNLYLRNAMGTLLTCAVASQVCGSLILTLEKFLKICFAMKPQIRIERKAASIFLIVSWLFCAAFAILPVFNVGRMSYISVISATPLPADHITVKDGKINKQMSAAAGTQIVFIIIQLASLILYLPIFFVAKRSGATLGIKREARIAKKIALLVFTNFIIFTVPMVFGVFQDDLWHNVFLDAFPKWQSLTLTSIRWVNFVLYALPAVCLSINSILNPLIYAFRHPKIKQHLKTNSTSARIQPS